MRKLVVLLALVLLPLGAARAQFCPGADPYVFTDVPANDAFCGFITRMAVDGITTGCQIIDANNRLFCPDNLVTRKQMSAFMIRLSDGLFPLNCAVGQLMKWNGTDWICAGDDVGGGGGGAGTLTSLAQGQGIVLAPNPITTLGVVSADTNFLQRRVALGCAGGSSIRQINADGTVTCETDDVGGGGSLPPAQAGQTLRHDGNAYIASSALMNDGTDIGLTGQLNLPAVARVASGGAPFIHNRGTFNTYVGTNAGIMTTTGGENTAVGYFALAANTTGSFNSVVGTGAGLSNTIGGANSFFGDSAGRLTTSGSYNTYLGYDAGYSNVAGGGNSFAGALAGRGNTTGNYNAFFGYRAGEANTTAGDNAFFGREAGLQNTTGTPNAFFGATAGYANTTGGFNAFFGTNAGLSNTTGNENSFFGANAGRVNSTASFGAFFGAAAGIANTTGSANSFFGWRAGQANTTGSSNAYFGSAAGFQSTTGSANAFFGAGAGSANLGGSSNAFFGKDAGFSNNTGSSNAFLGQGAGFLNTAGHDNTFAGTGAGSNNTSGNFNTFVGQLAGLSNATGSNNTYLGSGAGGTPGLTHATAIGAGALVERSNSVVLGSGIDNVGIGTTSPQERLHVVGQAIVTGTLFKGGGAFRIDHPVEPANKVLSHSFVESPDMKNIYDGIVALDGSGEATVRLPEWFGALNSDFRYQLTCIGAHAPVYIAEEVADNRFRIAGGRAGMKVSWQVTGIRQDAWANANRIAVEEDKPAYARGHYLHPQAYGMPRERSIEYARRPEPAEAGQPTALASTTPLR